MLFSSQVQIQNKKVDISKVSSKCGSKANIKHKPGEWCLSCPGMPRPTGFHPLCPRHSIKTSGAVPTQDSGGLAHPQPLAGCGNRDTKLSVGGARPSLEDVLCARCGPRPGARCVPGVVVAEGAPGGGARALVGLRGGVPALQLSPPLWEVPM